MLALVLALSAWYVRGPVQYPDARRLVHDSGLTHALVLRRAAGRRSVLPLAHPPGPHLERADLPAGLHRGGRHTGHVG